MVTSTAPQPRQNKKTKYGYHEADKVKVSKGNKTKRGLQRPLWLESPEY